MSDHYHHFLSSMAEAGAEPFEESTDQNSQAQYHYPGTGIPLDYSGSHDQYSGAGYIAGPQEPSPPDENKSKKGRKKGGVAGPGTEAVKHRRTRSGCFTCRSRRVKCDESRPTCCRKADRDCVYPDPPAPKAGSRSKESGSASQHKGPVSPSDDAQQDTRVRTKLEPIQDEEEKEHVLSQSGPPTPGVSSLSPPDFQRLSGRQSSETPSQDGYKSSSPSASTVTSTSMTATPYQASDYTAPEGRPDWSHLPVDMRYHLAWFDENMSNYHYCLNNDSDDFFKTILPSIAVQHEPLLNALVGFSAYHQTLQNPDGKIEDFLQYYNKSVTMLLTFLKRKEKHNINTLLTILQLATIEEYLGDWINLMGHQKAAFEIFSSLFPTYTVMETPIGRTCLSWYARFDNFVAMMGGFPTSLPRQYFSTFVNFYESQAEAYPEELRFKIAGRSARMRLHSYDMSFLYARNARGQISPADFAQEHDRMTSELTEWRNTWDPQLTDPAYLVKNYPRTRPFDPDDIVDPYEYGILYDYPLFTSTVIAAEYEGLMIMHKTQSPHMPSEKVVGELRRHCYNACQGFETIEFWPHTPKGVTIMVQAVVQIASLFLPHDQRHLMWLRRKFALTESSGYIIPKSRREKMALLFQDPACVRWWLPDDEGLTPVLLSIRDFADERNAAAVTAQQESLREVRHLFEKLELGGQPATGETPGGRAA